MNNPMRVQVLESLDDLQSVTLYLELMETLAPLQQLIHTLILTELKENIHILWVLKEMLKQTNMIVLDRPMNLDLTHKLLLGSALSQTWFLDDLGSVDELRLTIDKLIALSKASLAEIFAFDVPLYSNLAIRLFEFLFNDLLLLIDSASLVLRLLLHVYLSLTLFFFSISNLFL